MPSEEISPADRPAKARNERILLALVIAVSMIAVALFAAVTTEGRAPDERLYYHDIQELARTGALSSSTGHPQLYSAVSLPAYFLGRTDAGRQELIRLLGVLFMAGTVYATYKTSSELFGAGSLARWAPPLLVALLPQFAFIAGSVNSDGLLAMLAATFFYLCVRVMRRPAGPLALVALGAVSVLGVLTKQRFLVLLPVLLPVLAVAAHVRFAKAGSPRSRRIALWGSAAGGAVLVLVLGVLAVKVIPTVFPAGALASWRHLARVVNRSFLVDLFAMTWGHFDWLVLPMSLSAYAVFAALSALAVLGIAIAVIRRFARRGRKALWDRTAAVWLVVVAAMLLTFGSVIQYRLAGFWPQGRYLFIALVPFALFVGRGLDEIVPRAISKAAFRVLTLTLAAIVFAQIVFVLVPYYY